MNLNLNRPLVFLDLETTGINVVTDRVVEIAMLKINPDGREEELIQLINPEMEIPRQAIAIHGISNEDVQDAPLFSQKLIISRISCDTFGFRQFKSGCCLKNMWK